MHKPKPWLQPQQPLESSGPLGDRVSECSICFRQLWGDDLLMRAQGIPLKYHSADKGADEDADDNVTYT